MVPGKSPDWLPPENGKVEKGINYKAENVEQPFTKPDIHASPDTLGLSPKKKSKGGNYFEMVTSASASADGIPVGWIKQTRTSRSGNKIRKDLFYIDPNSGYLFSSKKDVSRYLETNDISSCATKPKKMELDIFQLNKKEILPSSSVDEKLSKCLESSEEPSIPGKLNDGGDSSPKCLAAPEDAKILVKTQDDNSRIREENKARENLNEADTIKNHFESPNEGSEDLRVTNPEFPMAESIIKQELPPSDIDKQTDTGSVSSKNSKKRKGSNLPSRTSKRLAGCEPEVQTDIGMSERNFMAAAKRSSTSTVETLPHSSLETSVDLPPSSKEATPEVIEENSHDVLPSKTTENNKAGNQASPDEKRIEFCKSWSDPCLEFAFKTLTEEIPFEDTLAFSGRFGKKLPMSHNQLNNCFKPSESDGTRFSQKGILAHSESLEEKGAVSLLPSNSTNFLSCGVSSQQSSTEGRIQAFPMPRESVVGKETGNAQVSLRQSEKKNPLSFSSGVSVSKGFAGLGQEKVPNTVTGKQLPRTTAEDSQAKEQKVEPLHSSNKPPVENQTISNEKRVINHSKPQESLTSFSFQNTWSDPCLEFAFKTLTGELPVENSLASFSHIGNQSGIPFNQANQ